MSKVRVRVLFAVLTIVLLGVAQNLPAQFRGPRDPGVRGGAAGAGGMLAGLNAAEQEMFAVGRDDFNEAEEVGDGLGGSPGTRELRLDVPRDARAAGGSGVLAVGGRRLPAARGRRRRDGHALICWASTQSPATV